MPGRRAPLPRNRLVATKWRAPILAALYGTLVASMPALHGLRAAEESSVAGGGTSAASMIQSIESRIKRLRENKEIEDDRREELVDIYTKALEQLRTADELTAKAAEWAKSCETAPADIEKVNGDLAKIGDDSSTASVSVASTSGDLAKMQQALARSETERDHRRQELEELNDESDRRAERRHEIAERDEEIATELREVQEELDRERDEDDEAELARQALAQARRRALLQEEEMHRQELLAYEATAELVAVQRDLMATRLQSAEDLLDAWQKAVNDFRRSEADRLHAEAQRRAELAPPALRPIAAANVALAAARRDMAARIEETIADSEAATSRLDELREQFEKVTERAKRIGFTEAIGLLLRKHRDALSVVDESMQNKRARAANVSEMSVLLTDYEEQRAKLADMNSRVKSEKAKLLAGVPQTEAAVAEAELRDLLETQRRSLDALIRDTTRYVEELMELESVERQLVACVREFTAFSDEHILWIRSTGFPQAADAKRLAAAAGWLARPAHWQRAGRLLAHDAATHFVLYASLGFVLAGSAVGPWYIRRRLGRRSDARVDSVRPPSSSLLSALLLGGLAAARWPALAAFVGVRLSMPAEADEFLTALGRALTGIAFPGFLAGGLCRIVARRDTAVDLLGWDERQADSRRRLLRLTAWAVIPLALVVALSEAQRADGPRNTIGRLAFVLLMGICAELARRLWRGTGRSSKGETPLLLPRGLAVARFATVVGPLALAAGSLAGYHYTAIHLALRSFETAGFFMCVLMLHALCARWAVSTNRTRPADLDVGESGTTAIDQGVMPVAAATEANDGVAKPAALSAQVQRLVRLGSVAVLVGGALWIWSGIVPALKLLHSVAVWPLPVEFVDPALPADEAAKIVTLAGLLAALGVAVVTFAAARNVRGALEVTMLRRLPLDAGARYAVAAIARYLIALVGLLGTCSCLGIGASQLNWLVAAMTVGLGFGLQEIFANFVSGLILLFERPVRIGDIVSVEGVTGTVSRIRIRATTITDGDMRELIVPNKELITGRVINWTLSNTVARMTISVRTAHGVDPDKARNLLLSVAAQHPLVLQQPGPQALFDEFSDKTQNFTLRVFMANCEVYPQLRHELLTSIQRTFRQAGISLNSSDAASLPVPVLPHEQRAA